MRQLASQKPSDPEQVYANWLYLSGNRSGAGPRWRISIPCRAASGTAIFRSLPTVCKAIRCWNPPTACATAAKSRRLKFSASAACLHPHRPDAGGLGPAAWRSNAAKTTYSAVLQREPQNEDAILGLTEIYSAEGNKDAARAELAKLPAAQNGQPLSLNMQRRIAMAQAGLGDFAAAEQTYKRSGRRANPQPTSMESALVLRDAARFQTQNGQPQQALETYKDAMVSSGITTTRPVDNDSFTRLTRNDEKDDWLKRGVRSDAGDLYRQQDINVTLQHDYWGSSGTGGYSDLKAHTTMLQVDAPLSDGRMFFRSDLVNMDAGTFDNNNGTYQTLNGGPATTRRVAATPARATAAPASPLAGGVEKPGRWILVPRQWALTSSTWWAVSATAAI